MRLGTLYRDIGLKDISYTEVDVIKIDILIRRALTEYINESKPQENVKEGDEEWKMNLKKKHFNF